MRGQSVLLLEMILKLFVQAVAQTTDVQFGTVSMARLYKVICLPRLVHFNNTNAAKTFKLRRRWPLFSPLVSVTDWFGEKI